MTELSEVIYQAGPDVLQIWIKWGRPSVNRHVRDGLYEIRDLETDELLGWEIIDFQDYAQRHERAKAFADRLAALKSEEVILREVEPGQWRELVSA